jgi:beta propeller repeat protein
MGTATTEIYGVDLQADETFRVTSSSGRQERPTISGFPVVWQDNRNGNWDISARDLDQDRGEWAVADQTGDQLRPAVSGRTVVWEDWRDHTSGPDGWPRSSWRRRPRPGPPTS